MNKQLKVMLITFLGMLLLPIEYCDAVFKTSDLRSIQSRHTQSCIKQIKNTFHVKADDCFAKNKASFFDNIQTWRIKSQARGGYFIINNETKSCMTNLKQLGKDVTRARPCNPNGLPNQVWDLVPIKDSNLHVILRNRGSKLCLVSDVKNQSHDLKMQPCKTQFWSQHWAIRGKQVKNHTWDPLMTSDCLVSSGPEEDDWYQILPDGLSDNCDLFPGGSPKSAWFLSMTNEHRPFPMPGIPNPVSMRRETNNWDFMPGDFRTLANYNMRPLNKTRKQLGLQLNKRGFTHRNDKFTYYGVTDHFNFNKRHPNISLPKLKDNIWLDVNLGLYDYFNEGFGASWEGEARGRVLVAASIRSKGKIYFLEINLYRDELMDFCHLDSNPIIPNAVDDPNCDRLSNLFDRRTRHIPRVGDQWQESEYIQLNAKRLHTITGYRLPQITLKNKRKKFPFMIPLTRIARSNIWYDAPDFSDATIAGIYIGIEAWGGVRMGIELDGYRIYSVQNEPLSYRQANRGKR